MVPFRSLLVLLTAVPTSLLSYGAALLGSRCSSSSGATWRRCSESLRQVHFALPSGHAFAILWPLMDYQVFIVSRMQEEWEFTRTTRPGGLS